MSLNFREYQNAFIKDVTTAKSTNDIERYCSDMIEKLTDKKVDDAEIAKLFRETVDALKSIPATKEDLQQQKNIGYSIEFIRRILKLINI
ncbi:hypothetical protein QTN47_10915 [Danxiaibacter flavus]|uniref:Uncharacterized protein n=1 Tax=Danxiaibacter flavus TaxID=3049108 RepID=A0ABV3ZHX4_9BACT|nr:hypothetical protein QNM32_10920 [Chitinophagaceae bacterium DXS]